MTVAVEEKLHPLNPLTYQLTFARTELATLVAELKKAEARRRSLIVQGVVKPLEEKELKDTEQQIGTTRLKIDRIKVKIEGLEEDLPRVDVETRNAVENLETAKERMPLITPEIETLDAEAVKLCQEKAVKRLVEISKERTALVEELQSTIPNLILGAEGYLHLAPSRREEFPEAPEKPEQVRDLVEILKR